MIRAALWILLGRWSYNLISLVSFGIIIALISVPDYGAWAIASTTLILSDVFFQDAGENAIVRQQGEHRDVAWSSFWVILLFGCGIAATAALVAPLLGMAYGNDLIAELTRASAGVIVVQAVSSVARGMLLRLRKTRAFALTLSMGNLIGAAIGIGSVLSGFGVWALLLQQLTVHMTVLILAWVQADVGPPHRGSPQTRKDIAHFLRFGLGNALLNVGVNRLDVIFASVLFGEAGAGQFGLAKRIIQIVQDLVGSSFDKALVAFKSRFSGEKEAESEAFDQSVIAQALMTMPTFVGLALVASLAVPLVFGSEWAEAGPLVALMAVGGIFRTMVTLERAEQVVAGAVWRLLAVRFADGIVALALILPFAYFGLEAMALIFSLRYLISYLLVVLSHTGPARVPPHLLRVARLQWPTWIGSLVMAGGIYLLQSQITAYSREQQLVLLVAAAVLLYGLTMALLARIWLPFLWGKRQC